MRSNKICLNCGSSAFVSDRSLGGRIVCLKCGSSSFREKAFFRISNKQLFIIIFVVIVFCIIII